MVGAPLEAVLARSIRRVPKEDSGDGMLFNSIEGVPWELQPGVESEIVNRVQLDVRAAISERQAPPLTTGDQLPKRVYIRRSVELVYRLPACEIGIEADGSQRVVPCQDCEAHNR